jgi:cation:H+ antiporter
VAYSQCAALRLGLRYANGIPVRGPAACIAVRVFENLPALSNAAIFAAAAFVVWMAGSRLARYADKIAEQTGLGRELLGVLLLGVVTSLPELTVGVSATLAGTPLLSINDVLGSAGINVVMLAAADAAYGRKALTSTPAAPEVLLLGALCIIVLSLVVGAVTAGDVAVWGIGAWSWLILAAYFGAIWIVSRSQGRLSWVPAHRSVSAPPRDAKRREDASLRPLLLRTAAVSAAILVAGFVLARSGDALARQSGLGASFFGAVLLGASTSLPELSTVLAAVRLHRYEMALANVLGTNLFNMNIIVLVDALHPGDPVLVEAGRFAAFGALLAIVLTAVFLVGLIERRDRTVLRMGIDSLAAIVCYVAGVAVLYQLR